MTYESKSVFGFIVSTMDDAISLLKDGKQMLRITTKTKKYVSRSEGYEELVRKIKTLYNI